jgi:two-component sensor histidine kinase
MLSTIEIKQEPLSERDMFFRQSLKYADDLVRVYEEEKERRRFLERANEKLTLEIAARRKAERELRQVHRELDQRVRERTEALSQANDQLRLEIEQRRNAEDQMRAALKEKEVLLAEIHHRVKNNLQIISSLMALQSDQVSDQRVVGALKDSQSRIRSIALIHEQLYRSANLSQIDFSHYLTDLTSALMQTHGSGSPTVRIVASAQNVVLDISHALPCGLIINELVSNALKHAFPGGRRGEIHVSFVGTDDHVYALTVSDNGLGLPEGFDLRSAVTLGLRLVANLAQVQLKGDLEVDGRGGTTFRIRFKRPGKTQGRGST